MHIDLYMCSQEKNKFGSFWINQIPEIFPTLSLILLVSGIDDKFGVV